MRPSCLFPGDITNELVRHFLIETSPRGVKLKGCPNEPNFGECPQCVSHRRGWVGRALPLLEYQSRAVGCLGEPPPLLLCNRVLWAFGASGVMHTHECTRMCLYAQVRTFLHTNDAAGQGGGQGLPLFHLCHG